MRVAAYCRVSTSQEKNMRSLENQIRYYRETIVRREGWDLVGIYTDPGISGTDIRKRPGFSRLLSHCRQGRIDLVLTKSISRFSRNTGDFLQALRLLRKLRVDVFFEKEGIRLSETQDEFLLTIFAAVAQQEAVNISRNVQWGYEKRFLRGIPKAAPILGYVMFRRDGEPVIRIHPEEARVVQQIFRWFLSGWTLTEICQHLTEQGIPTKKGHTVWAPFYVKYILTNERYTGDVLAGARPSTIVHLRPDTRDREPIRIPDSHPPIVDKASFRRAGELLNARKRTSPSRTRRRYPLSGRLVCGLCGRNFHLFRRPEHLRSWHCAGRNRPVAGCDSVPVREAELLAGLRAAFVRRFGRNSDPLDRMAGLLEYNTLLDTLEETRLSHILRILSLDPFTAGPDPENPRKRELAEKEYGEFEEKARMLDEDQEYFAGARHHLAGSRAWEEFLETLTIPVSRGWVYKIEVYSPDIFCACWWDGQVTWIGDPRSVPALAVQPPLPASGVESIPSEGPDLPAESAREVRDPLSLPALLNWRKQDFFGVYESLKDPERKLRVCAYCRVSTQEDLQTASLAAQIAYHSHLILGNPDWVFSGIYFDLGASGTSTDNRPEFLRMLRDCEAGKIDRVITKSVSRFSRNVLDTLRVARNLRTLQNPVSIFFENEGIDTGSSRGDVALSVCAGLAQEESCNHSENVKWGLKKTVERGAWIPGTHNYIRTMQVL